MNHSRIQGWRYRAACRCKGFASTCSCRSGRASRPSVAPEMFRQGHYAEPTENLCSACTFPRRRHYRTSCGKQCYWLGCGVRRLSLVCPELARTSRYDREGRCRSRVTALESRLASREVNLICHLPFGRAVCRRLWRRWFHGTPADLAGSYPANPTINVLLGFLLVGNRPEPAVNVVHDCL